MKSADPTPPNAGFGVQDVLYVIFKHKWKIVLLTLLGLAAAGGIAWKEGYIYESRAKLLVRYVRAYSDIDAWESQKEAGGRSGDYVTNAEIEILTSRDLARMVVEAVGVERFFSDEEQEDELDGFGIVSRTELLKRTLDQVSITSVEVNDEVVTEGTASIIYSNNGRCSPYVVTVREGKGAGSVIEVDALSSARTEGI